MKNIFASTGLQKLVNYNIVSLEDIDDEMRKRFIEYFDKVRSDIDTFIHVESDYNIKKVNTDMGKQHALIKEWTSEQKTTVVEIWIAKNKYYIGYAIKYETNNMRLIFDLPNLEVLDLANNELTEVSIFNLPKLRVLDLSDNKLTKIYHVPELQRFYLSNNELTEAPVFDFSNLRILKMTNNKLTEKEKIKIKQKLGNRVEI